MAENEQLYCCVCYDELESPGQPLSTDELLERLEKTWNSVAAEDPAENDYEDSTNAVFRSENREENTRAPRIARRVVEICRNRPDLHLACDFCAFKLVKQYPRANRCPLCKGSLSSGITLCQRLRSSENRVKSLLAQQKTARKQLSEKVKRLCDEFGSRLSYTSYFVDAHPEPSSQTMLTIDTSNFPAVSEHIHRRRGDGVRVAWTRKQTGSRLAETLSLDVSKHDLFEESEWMRVIEHTSGLRLVSTAALSRKMFQDRCAELQTDILLCTRATLPSSDITEDASFGATNARTTSTGNSTNDFISEAVRGEIAIPASSFNSGQPSQNHFLVSSAPTTFRPTSSSSLRP